MDRNLHTDDFERLLREKSDEFRMYPSKRIWYSVYNNIHPGRKWPSVVMSIVLITSLLWIGYLNTSEPNRVAISSKSSQKQAPGLFTQTQFKDYQYQPFSIYNPLNSFSTFQKSLSAVNIPVDTGFSTNITASITSPVTSAQVAKVFRPRKPATKSAILYANNVEPINATGSENSLDMVKIEPGELLITNTIDEAVTAQQDVTETGLGRLLSTKMATADAAGINVNPEGLVKQDEIAKPASASSLKTTPRSLSQDEKDWIENYALYNRPVPKKWAGKLAWQMYATPSVVFRQLQNDPNFGATANSAPFVIPVNNQDINSQVIQKPSFGLEAGFGIQYPLLKGLRLKSGLQLNFTRYNSLAYHNTHPVATKLTMHDYTTNSTYELFRTTPYSNKTGLSDVKLHNETYQISIPVGLDFKIAGKEALQWNVGVTIQPTYVIGGTSYLISSDRRNYVKESSMLNRWNINAGFETFLSYKVNGLTYQIGPQFRSQLFSSNIKEFAVEERLLTYGIKFGIMKTLK